MKQVPLQGRRGLGKFTIVDDEDHHWLSNYRWILDSSGRAVTMIYACKSALNPRRSISVTLMMHRFIMQPAGKLVVDHINGEPLDSRKANLRICTIRQNSCNRIGKTGRAGFKGVKAGRRAGTWVAYIRVQGQMIHLGQHPSANLDLARCRGV